MRRVSDEQVVLAYKETGSVWKAGKHLGITGQSVHDRLRALDYPIKGRHWSPGEDAELRSLVDSGLTLGEISKRLGRSYAGTACRISRLDIRMPQKRNKKLPRGAGWDKVSTTRHMRALQCYDGPITRYARMNGLDIESLSKALQQHCPDDWRAYTQSRSDIPEKVCAYCGCTFIPANGKQAYCTRKCAADARRDRSYFGGKRRNTIGLAEGVCQLCKRSVTKGLSSHHVLGKENDPGNEVLVALCAGCHKIVTLLGSRNFLRDPESLETLIVLAIQRKEGDKVSELPENTVLHVTVDIDQYVDEEEYLS